MKVWVFIGRLNPPHLWHLNTIEKSLRDDDKTIVILGSANLLDENNPFDVIERWEMLKLNFPESSFIIESLEDTENDLDWVFKIRDIILNNVLEFKEISFYWWDFENDSAIKVLKLFEKELWFNNINFVEYSRKNLCLDHNWEVCYYSSTLVRECMKRWDKELLEKLLSKEIFIKLKDNIFNWLEKKYMKTKILILHDTFLYKWGWERLIMMMWKALNADIASGFFSEGSFDLRKEGFKWKMISISSEIFKKGFRHIKLKWAFLFKTKFLSDYDTVIFSWDSISAVRNCSQTTKKIYYCHTPPRYIYDLHELYLEKVPFIIKPAFKLFCFVFKKMYERDVKQMDLVLTNSVNTQKRIKDFLWIDAKVLYPPVDLDIFKYMWQWDYFLSFARLSDAKRVDKIVEAFKKMPDKKLVVIYWENDPQRQKVFDLAVWSKNIEFVTLPWNVWFTDYVGNSIATIYIPIDEDFGMSPVESMAAWKPVLWVNDGWLKETIIDSKTGYLIDKEARVEDIIEVINKLSPEKCLEMRSDCEKRAHDFSLAQFELSLKEFVK